MKVSVSSQKISTEVTEIVLENSLKTQVTLWSWGATLAKLVTSDRWGDSANIVLSLPIEICQQERHYLGTTIGPVAGRISRAQIKLGDRIINLTANEGVNHLHGGKESFDQQNWQVGCVGQTETTAYVEFVYRQKALTNGYPGNLIVSVRYTLTIDNQLIIDYQAECDQQTLFNPTNHSYFNLSGGTERTISKHYLQVMSDYYIPIGTDNLPLGNKQAVKESVFSLKTATLLEEILMSNDLQIKQCSGLNHGFELLSQSIPAIVLYHPESGRRVQVTTTEPSVVIYTGNHFDGSLTMSNQLPLNQYGGVAMETQQLPDCENHIDFGTIILEADEVCHSQTIMTFDVVKNELP